MADRDLVAEFDTFKDVLSKRMQAIEEHLGGTVQAEPWQAFTAEVKDRFAAMEQAVTNVVQKAEASTMSPETVKTVLQARKLIDTYYHNSQALHVDE